MARSLLREPPMQLQWVLPMKTRGCEQDLLAPFGHFRLNRKEDTMFWEVIVPILVGVSWAVPVIYLSRAKFGGKRFDW
jgi:hypothetical protein